MFVQFVSLCYYEYFSEKIHKVKRLLENEINSGELDSNAQKLTKKLYNWINNTPLYLRLQWFDTVDDLTFSICHLNYVYVFLFSCHNKGLKVFIFYLRRP